MQKTTLFCDNVFGISRNSIVQPYNLGTPHFYRHFVNEVSSGVLKMALAVMFEGKFEGSQKNSIW